MTGAETYARAPIVEASLLIRLDVPDDAVSITDAADIFAAETSLEISERQTVFEISNTLVAVDEKDSSLEAAHRSAGFDFRGDGERIAIVDDELQYSRRYSEDAPYEVWEIFVKRGMELAAEAIKARGASRAIGIGARFVNELPTPTAEETSSYEISDYVRMSVPVPWMLPQVVSRMFAQVDVPFKDDGVKARITVFTDEQSALILDIDVRKNIEATEISGLWDYLSVIRSIKNAVFEGAITDACRWRMRIPRESSLGGRS